MGVRYGVRGGVRYGVRDGVRDGVGDGGRDGVRDGVTGGVTGRAHTLYIYIYTHMVGNTICISYTCALLERLPLELGGAPSEVEHLAYLLRRHQLVPRLSEQREKPRELRRRRLASLCLRRRRRRRQEAREAVEKRRLSGGCNAREVRVLGLGRRSIGWSGRRNERSLSDGSSRSAGGV